MSELRINQSNPNQVAFEGEMTRETVMSAWPEQATSIASLKGTKLAVDLAKVEQLDTAGLAYLLSIVKDCQQQDVTLTLQNTPSSLVNLAKLSDVDSILPFE